MTGNPVPRPGVPRTEPAVGLAVRDTAHDRVGVVMGHEGPYLQLRPLSGAANGTWTSLTSNSFPPPSC